MRVRPAAVAVCCTLLVHCLAFRGASRAADAPPPAPPPAPAAYAPPGAAAPAPDPNDLILSRILRSGCRDGLAEARALAVTGGSSWAETVTRLCGQILAVPATTPVTELSYHEGERNGRPAIVIYSSVYGIWLGVATDVLIGLDDIRGAIVPPLLGMGAGLGLSLLATSDHPITGGQAWTIATGYDYGTINGALWAGGLDFSAKGVVGTALATGLSASAIGLLVAAKMEPRQGDIEVVRSGLLWGTATGMLVMAMVQVDDEKTFLRGTGVAMDLGFLAGLAFAASFDISRNRDLLIDAGAAGGAFLGFGVTWLITAGPNMSGRALAGGTLAGIYAGMGTLIYLTRHMDAADDADAPQTTALLGRDQRGRWSWGTPAANPVFDGTGHRLVGATLTAVGGTF
jgi:hypothetical protein